MGEREERDEESGLSRYRGLTCGVACLEGADEVVEVWEEAGVGEGFGEAAEGEDEELWFIGEGHPGHWRFLGGSLSGAWRRRHREVGRRIPPVLISTSPEDEKEEPPSSFSDLSGPEREDKEGREPLLVTRRKTRRAEVVGE